MRSVLYYWGMVRSLVYMCMYTYTHTRSHTPSHLDSDKENPLPPLHELLILSSSKGFLHAPSHRHGLCYTSRGALAGTRNSSIVPPWRIDPTNHGTMSERPYHRATSCYAYIYNYMHITGKGKGRKEICFFNDALNTFYLRLYGVRHMVKEHSDSKRGNPLPPHGLLFSINSKSSFICTIPQTG